MKWLLFTLLAAGGCSSNCDKSSLCAITGDLDSLQVCDGTGFKLCAAGNRGQVIVCPSVGQRATCTAGGWVFDQIAPLDM
jgi:hypothetical protein